jgi:two-component system, oxyanion-binding sensor
MIRVNAGFLPLVDATVLIICRELGFAEAHGIELVLSRETSWANIRDRLSVGQFDVAHMLAPLPIAQNLGLSPLREKLVVPFAMGLGGNAVTVSNALYSTMQSAGFGTKSALRETGATLKVAIQHWRNATKRKPVFAVVHDFSSHAYELRYWLAASGIDPAQDVDITIVPPGLMADALVAGGIDGFCVGEPWNSVAASHAAGHVVATKAAIWRSSPEKVLAMRAKWVEENGETIDALLRALNESAVWASKHENHATLAQTLSRPEYVAVHEELILRSLEGRVQQGRPMTDFMLFAERAAGFPWQSHALWFYSQMVRWQQIQHSEAHAERAKHTYRPDIYRRALQNAGVALPGASSKVEGALTEPTFMPAKGGRLLMGPDGFFDGVEFDPDALEAYIRDNHHGAALHKK